MCFHQRVTLVLPVLLALPVKTVQRVCVVIKVFRAEQETLAFVEPLAPQERKESLERMGLL